MQPIAHLSSRDLMGVTRLEACKQILMVRQDLLQVVVERPAIAKIRFVSSGLNPKP